jgi:hypothetical protein
MNDQQLYDELSSYTLSLRDPTFIHQHIVDAYAAQNADDEAKPITIAFALAGLYLHNEKGFSGREVQGAHMKLARNKQPVPRFELPERKGEITVGDVMCHAPGQDRDEAIERWSASVWITWKNSHARVTEWLEVERIVPR